MECKKRNVCLMLEPHQLLGAGNYKVRVSLESEIIWTRSLVIAVPGAGQALAKTDFLLLAWEPLIKKLKASRLRSAWNAPMELRNMLSLIVQMG